MIRCSVRVFLIRLLLLVCAACQYGAAADVHLSTKSGVTRDSCPNVLLIVSDDQRPDTIRALGNSLIHTPTLDSLVRQGMTFTRAIASNPICVPSRAEIMTGCDGFRNHVGVFGSRMNPDLTLWADCMRRAGYHTWYVGKWMNDGKPTNRGYEESDSLFASGGARWMKPQVDHHGRPVTGYRGWVFQDDEGNKFPEKGVGLTSDIDREFADAAIRFINRKPREPFFLHVNFTMIRQKAMMSHSIAVRGFAVAVGVSSWSGPFA